MRISVLVLGVVFSLNVFGQQGGQQGGPSSTTPRIDTGRLLAPSSDVRARFRIDHSSFGTTEEGYSSGLGIRKSGLEFGLGNQEFFDSPNVYRFRGLEDRGGFAWDVKMRFSTVPYFVEDMTLDELETNLDSALAIRKAGELTNARNQIQGFINQNFGHLSQAQQNAIFNQKFGEAEAQINSAFSQARTSEWGKIQSRVDQIQLETSIQDVSLSFGLWDGVASSLTFSYLRFGKYKNFGGLNTHDQMTDLDTLRPVNSRGQRVLSTAGTGAITLGWSDFGGCFHSDSDFSASLTFFSDRVPFVDGNDYVAQIVTMEDHDYDNHRNFWELDSQLLNVQLNGRPNGEDPYLDVALGVGNFRGDWGTQCSAVGHIPHGGSKSRVMVDTGWSQRDFLQKSFGVHYAIDFIDTMPDQANHEGWRISPYAGAVYNDGSREPLRTIVQDLEYFEPRAGFGCRYRSGRFFCTFGPEVFHRSYQGSSSGLMEDETDIRGGINGGWSIGPREKPKSLYSY